MNKGDPPNLNLTDTEKGGFPPPVSDGHGAGEGKGDVRNLGKPVDLSGRYSVKTQLHFRQHSVSGLVTLVC